MTGSVALPLSEDRAGGPSDLRRSASQPEALIPSAGAVAYVRGIIPNDDREKDDFYPTPPQGTRALLAVEKFNGPIWEPACGEGDMSRVLKSAGYDVISTDLVNRGYGTPRQDFLMEWQPRAPNIVTNPPFKLAEEFVRKALALTTGKVAILARLAWLEGKQRRDLFESTPLARVWIFAGRLSMSRGSITDATGAGGMIAFAWFVWEHGYQGPPQLGWVSPDRGGAQGMPTAGGDSLLAPFMGSPVLAEDAP